MMSKLGGKNRKYGRNKKWCEQYRARGQREKNRKLKWIREIKRSEYKNKALINRLFEVYRTKI